MVLLKGGLGNQLFQVAAGLGLGVPQVDEGLQLVSYGSEWGPEHPDASDLTGMAIRYPNRLLRSTLPGIAARETWRDDVSTVMARALGTLRGVHLIAQTDPYGALTAIPARTRTVVLDGFFQHRDWWLDSWTRLAAIINDRRPTGVDAIRAEARTVVKLRRSDYLGRGIVLSERYYEEALDRLGVLDCEVVVVSEDRDYLPHFERLLRDRGCAMREPEPLTGDQNVDDFWNLAAAGRQVLANSSYCWWAAAVSEVARDEPRETAHPRTAYPQPWLPNSWSKGPLPSMGLPGWTAVSAGFE